MLVWLRGLGQHRRAGSGLWRTPGRIVGSALKYDRRCAGAATLRWFEESRVPHTSQSTPRGGADGRHAFRGSLTSPLLRRRPRPPLPRASLDVPPFAAASGDLSTAASLRF